LLIHGLNGALGLQSRALKTTLTLLQRSFKENHSSLKTLNPVCKHSRSQAMAVPCATASIAA
jgi:hypothetical protein